MKNFLFIILVVVAAVLLWAIRTNAYADGLVFSLGLVAAALSGFLISDYFAKLGKQSLTNNLQVAQKENQALRERADLLQTQFNTATPHTEVEQFEQRIVLLEEEKAKLDGFSRAQTAEVANLKEKIESLQKSQAQLLEDSTIATESAKTQTSVSQDALTAAKVKIQELTDENTALREQNTNLIEKLDTKNTPTDPDTEGVIDRIVSEKTADETVANVIEDEDEAETEDSQPIVADRSFLVTELDTDELDTEIENNDADYGSSDNLQAIEGIGTKVDAALKAAGITNWEKLSMATPERLQTILDAHDKQFRAIDPTSWPEQARLLVHREFSKLKKYQEAIG